MEDALRLHNDVDYFYEDWATRLRRFTMGTAYALRPNRWATLPHVLRLSAGHLLKGADARMRFPETIEPRSDAGLVALCDDLSVPTLVRAYSQGIFPFCHFGPMKWWSPSERSVLLFENERIEDSTRKLLRKGTFRLTFDYAFADVMEACSKPRAGKTPLTWITPRIMDATWPSIRLATRIRPKSGTAGTSSSAASMALP